MENKKLAVLITGCTGGIGDALAREFHERGHHVIATARDPARLAGLASLGIETAALEVTDAESIAALVADLRTRDAWPDMLINNAGYGLMGPVAEVDLDDVRHQFEVNVVAVVALTQAMLPGMIERGSGMIVNISSVSGILTTPFAGIYSASKAAVNLLTDALRMEVAPFGIRVVTVQPGGIQSNFGAAASAGTDRYASGSRYAQVQDAILARANSSQHNATPAAEFAREMADAVLAEQPRAVVRIGSKSTAMPLMKQVMPTATLDRMLSRRFHLDRLAPMKGDS